MPQMPGGMGRMASMAAKAGAQRDQLPPGFEALGAGMTPARSRRVVVVGKTRRRRAGELHPPNNAKL